MLRDAERRYRNATAIHMVESKFWHTRDGHGGRRYGIWSFRRRARLDNRRCWQFHASENIAK